MEKHIAALLPLAIITIVCFDSNCQASKTYYDITLKEILGCEDEGTKQISFASTRLTKVSRYAYNYLTNYTLAIVADDNLSVVAELQAWGNGGWRPGFFMHDIPHACSGCKQLVPKWFREIIKNTGRDDCPIPPGTYEVKAYNVSFTEFNAPAWATGQFRAFNRFYSQDVLVGCIGVGLEVTSRRGPVKRKNRLNSY